MGVKLGIADRLFPVPNGLLRLFGGWGGGLKDRLGLMTAEGDHLLVGY